MLHTNGVESPSPQPRIHQTHPSSSPRSPNATLIVIIKLFSSSKYLPSPSLFSAAVFMFATNTTAGSEAPRWYNFSAFRYVVAANAIVAVYLLFEIVASVWEIYGGFNVFPELNQVWFDFGNHQVFAYLLLSVRSAGTELVRQLRGVATCTANNAFCIQSDIALALGFAGFLSLLISSLLSGFRIVCFIVKGSRFLL